MSRSSKPKSTRAGNAGALPRPAARTAVQLLLAYLEQEGVDTVFGIPGGPLMPFYEAMFAGGKIRPVITKHEEGAAFMADGYARVSGRLGVCCATTGPGATNALTGIACAYRDSVPVLLLTAQIALSAFGKGAAQESSPLGIDIVDMYKDVTKASVMLMAPEKIAEVTRHLLRTSLSGRSGPIHLSLPADMMGRPVPDDLRKPQQYRPPSELFDRRSVKEAAKLLLQARRPVLLAGYGVHLSRAYDELRGLAERLKIPVATTQKGKGVFPEDHALSLGVFGFAGSPQADAVILSAETDLLLGVGTSFGELSTHAWDPRVGAGRRILHIDVDPNEIGKNYSVDAGLVGDARHVLREINFQLERDARWLEQTQDLGPRLAALRALKAITPRFIDEASGQSTAVPLLPQRVVAEMRKALPADTILFVDIGNVMAWALHYYTVREPGGFFINMGFGSMGHGVAAAIGGKLAAPDRPVVALTGDAAFAMNGLEVHTAVENDVPVVWVVLNNGGHGMVHLGETQQFQGRFNTSLFRRKLNVAQIADAVGALSFVVEKPGDTERALAAALAAKRPAVIDARVDPAAVPPTGMRLATLEKFFSAPQ
ncbi:MAG: thiamine pyrophosphate-binding protein [Elusimicrobia bacterium]|jgi:acetolactate synthase-1/2/3 large subunit|nr:thiamine pyrophosphate-binding protein [Elusimicrobiota bacterium]MBK7207016.1 thiamine pyrophosphate-binding protein [Elusimicrobiota bacterium]MBK7545836.1 thiamine pyrophosphate-binding protein [Elusimicrobiota bacterium]MBK7575100.1 thiamine pyrophosphate-binding protein [Elusimicrobiota bacterium]MBK7687634.1 thiamine pyrophosphate-binding protein [Elusimicrobiota bacterium]